MKTYTRDSFVGHYPVGVAAVISAHNLAEATMILERELRKIGLPQSVRPNQLEELSIGSCIIICDGNY